MPVSKSIVELKENLRKMIQAFCLPCQDVLLEINAFVPATIFRRINNNTDTHSYSFRN